MADAIWERKFRGENISLTLDDFTAHRIREIKSAFGDEYGIPNRLVYLLALGEVDALTAALWIHGQKVGKPIGDMLTFEFNLSEFAEPDKPKRVPKGSKSSDPATKAETPSTETQ